MNDDRSDLATDEAASPSVGYAGKKRLIVLLLLVYAAVLGGISVFLTPSDDRPIDIMLGLPALTLVIWWCYTDANERDHRMGRITMLLLVLIFAVGFPLYLFETRGWGAFRAMVYSFLIAGGMMVCTIAGAVVTTLVSGVIAR